MSADNCHDGGGGMVAHANDDDDEPENCRSEHYSTYPDIQSGKSICQIESILFTLHFL